MKTISPGGGWFRQRNYRNPLEVVPEQTASGLEPELQPEVLSCILPLNYTVLKCRSFPAVI